LIRAADAGTHHANVMSLTSACERQLWGVVRWCTYVGR
jgi:hypothetical protein